MQIKRLVLSAEGIVQTKGSRPSLEEKKSVLEAAYGELDGLDLEMPEITDAQGAKPPGSFDPMTRFDKTTKSDGHGLANTHLPKEKKNINETGAGK